MAPASLSSPNDERAGVRSIRVHGEIIAYFLEGPWWSGESTLNHKPLQVRISTNSANSKHRGNFISISRLKFDGHLLFVLNQIRGKVVSHVVEMRLIGPFNDLLANFLAIRQD